MAAISTQIGVVIAVESPNKEVQENRGDFNKILETRKGFIKNGAFIGVEIGSVGGNGTVEGTDLSNNVWDAKFPFISPIYGAKVGYKHFFKPIIGIRAYVGFNYAQDSNQSFSGSVDFRANTNYVLNDTLSVDYSSFIASINGDVLIDFYNKEQSSFGAFVGIGLGYKMLVLNR